MAEGDEWEMQEGEQWEEQGEEEAVEHVYRPHEGPCRHYLNPLHYHVATIVTHDHPQEYRAQYGPQPRSGHRMASVGCCLYLLGGFHLPDPASRTGRLFNELWRFNTVSHVWRRVTPLTAQPPVISFAMAAWDGHVLQFGGTGVPFGNSIYNTLFLYNTKKDSWSQLPLSGQLPGEGYGQSCLVDGDHLYLAGGCTGSTFNMDVHRVALRTGECHCLWDSGLGDGPRVRYRHEMALHDDKLFMLGGGDQHVCLMLAQLDVFCLKTRSWDTVSTSADPAHGYPGARLCHAAVQLGRFVYLHGGDGGNARGLLGDAWRLCLVTLRWSRLSGADTPPLCFHAATATQCGAVYLHGGKRSATGRSAVMWRVASRVSRLQALAGQAVLALAPHAVTQVPPLELRRAGFPPSFIAEAELGRPLSPSPPPSRPASEGERGA